MPSLPLPAARRSTWFAGAALAALALLAVACDRSTPLTALPGQSPAAVGETEPASTAPPDPTDAPSASAGSAVGNWAVEIVQGGAALPEVNAAVGLPRAPFTLRVHMPAPAPLKLNVFNTDQNFQALQPGFGFTDDCLLALCTGMDVAEERLNPGAELFVDVELTHYLYYQAPDDHRWSRVELAGGDAVLERDVAVLSGIPVEQTTDPALYLLFYLDQGSPQQIDPGELKKLVLLFE